MTHLLGVLFDGLAYGMLLFVLSVGLSVTMGLMGFVNLAHCAFAMLGGYFSVTLMQRAGVPFLATLPVAFILVGVFSTLFERVLYRRLYRAGELDQVLLTIGLVLMAVASCAYFWGTQQQVVNLPPYLFGRFSPFGIDLGYYRLFLIAVGVAIALALVFGLERTRFGAQVRTWSTCCWWCRWAASARSAAPSPPRCCSASATSRVNTMCRRPAPSSFMR
jgi:branched-chain amino acid transport system permease protein